jgi:hypothetical protein
MVSDMQVAICKKKVLTVLQHRLDDGNIGGMSTKITNPQYTSTKGQALTDKIIVSQHDMSWIVHSCHQPGTRTTRRGVSDGQLPSLFQSHVLLLDIDHRRL